MGYTEKEFRTTTPHYFYAAQRGFEQREQAAWERMRWMAYFALMPHIKKNTLKTPADLLSFPWEQGSKRRKVITPDMLAEADAEWAKMKSESAEISA